MAVFRDPPSPQGSGLGVGADSPRDVFPGSVKRKTDFYNSLAANPLADPTTANPLADPTPEGTNGASAGTYGGTRVSDSPHIPGLDFPAGFEHRDVSAEAHGAYMGGVRGGRYSDSSNISDLDFGPPALQTTHRPFARPSITGGSASIRQSLDLDSKYGPCDSQISDLGAQMSDFGDSFDRPPELPSHASGLEAIPDETGKSRRSTSEIRGEAKRIVDQLLSPRASEMMAEAQRLPDQLHSPRASEMQKEQRSLLVLGILTRGRMVKRAGVKMKSKDLCWTCQ
eukprot:gene26021-11720_t